MADDLRVGIIGCGDRGTGAVTQALLSTKYPVKLWAMGDLFRSELDKCFNFLQNGGKGRYDREDIGPLKHLMGVPESRKFVGFDAYQKVIESGVDIVILTCPPHFRPKHFKAAVEAGINVFMEKPVAVDPAGIRSVLKSAQLAKQKGISVVAGTQRRHQKHYLEIIKRIHDGAIGDIIAAQCYWNGEGSSLTRPKPDGMSDMEWQCRRWYYWTWLSGDHIVEQHVHNIDIINWALRAHPVSAMGLGGRAARKGGNIWDHFAVEFEYPGGIKATSYCRQIKGTSWHICERIAGTKGYAYIDSSNGYIKGQSDYEAPASPNPYVQEHADLINTIVTAKPINEAQNVAESTMAAIIGRMSAYTGRALKWDWAMNSSKLDLSPGKYELGPLPAAEISMPGITKLI